MVLDYSKWDALELSDDSDIEVHPNVDKRSFIRAKQAQIHQQREQRRHDIQTLKYERIINDGLLSRIDSLLNSLRQHESTSREPEEVVFQAIMDFASNPSEDQAPPPPEGVHTQEKEQPKYSQMMSSLVDQVKKEFGDSKPDNIFQAYIKGVEGHKEKVQGLQKELLQKLAQLEKEEGSRITSDTLHTGFDTSHVARPAETKGKTPAGEKKESVELLNPGVGNKDDGAEADEDDDEENPKASALAKRFAMIKPGDYKTMLHFISEHPDIVAEKETDGLLVEAFNSQLQGKEDYARQCVHQGLLLQYCRSLGRDGVSLFFKRYVCPILNHNTANILPASRQKSIKRLLFSETTSTKPTTGSRPARQKSPTKARPTIRPAWNKSSYTPSTRTPKSPSTSLPSKARTLLTSRLATSSLPSLEICRLR